MADKKLIEVSLKKSYEGTLGGSLDSVLFQNICETALECMSENEKYKERLQISPQGDDKIDELESALEAVIEHYKHKNNCHVEHIKKLDRKILEQNEKLNMVYEHQRGQFWYWMDDGDDHLETMANDLPVVIKAETLRELLESAKVSSETKL